MEFAPCSTCRRHVRVDEGACPFCGTAIRDARPVHRSLLGRASRAAVFASAATLAGCYTSSTPGGPPPPPPPDPNGNVYQPDPGDVRFAKPPQADRGAISGVLTDWNNRPAPGHPIELLGRDNNERRNTTTDARGAYAFGDLPPGHYEIIFQRTYSRHQGAGNVQEIEVIAGTNTRVDTALYPPPPPDRGPCCKPYGAPPARKRIV